MNHEYYLRAFIERNEAESAISLALLQEKPLKIVFRKESLQDGWVSFWRRFFQWRDEQRKF